MVHLLGMILVTVHSDWTERHRPQGELDLVGNDRQRAVIRSWLKEWEQGIPDKPGLILIGPPGVGKTSVVRAVAADNEWHVIELNASDDRNAGAIRRAVGDAGRSRQLMEFVEGGAARRTIILVDEADHLSGGLNQISNQRIADSMDPERSRASLKGDTGGKGEVIRLLQETRHPVVLCCNEAMKLWGVGTGWRDRRRRFTDHSQVVIFERASKRDLRRVARNVIERENLVVEEAALDLIVDRNPGDLRALIRDLQSVVSSSGTRIIESDVERIVSSTHRDRKLNDFAAVLDLLRARSSIEARDRMTYLDLDPFRTLDWLHWNAQLCSESHGNQTVIARLMSVGGRAGASRYRAVGHRSTYWVVASCICAAVATEIPPRFRLRYPDYLRRFSSRSTGASRLSELCLSSRDATRLELWPLIDASLSKGDDASDISLSWSLGLDLDDHLSLHGLRRSWKRSQAVVDAWDVRESAFTPPQVDITVNTDPGREFTPPSEDISEVPKTDSSQTRLF